MRKFIPGIILTLVVLPILGIGAALLGLINANADQAPSKAERWLSMRALDASVERRAPHDPNPVPVNDATLIEGMVSWHSGGTCPCSNFVWRIQSQRASRRQLASHGWTRASLLQRPQHWAARCSGL